MNTTVITAEAHDFGAGRDRRVEFVGCRWKVDDRGTLHIYREPARDQTAVTIAAFAPGSWTAATNGSITGAESVTVTAVKK